MKLFLHAVLAVLLIAVVAIVAVDNLAAQGPRVHPTLGAAAAITEITALRTRTAQLEAQLIDRDRQLANLRYEYGKRLLEVQADLDEARLNKRAESTLLRLRDLVKPDADALLDWSTGQFVKPKEPKPASEGAKK